MTTKHPQRDLLDRTFEVGIVLKGLDGVLELIGGVVLLAVSPIALSSFLLRIASDQLSEDPHDFIALHLLHTANGLKGSAVLFGAIYLLSHGVVKVVLVAALLKEKLWAYPWMIAFLVVFIGYQLYRLAVDATIGMALLTVFDVFIVWLTFLEYGRHERRVRLRT